MESDDVIRTERERGRRSPAKPLQEAVSYLKAVSVQLGTGGYGAGALAEALGHSTAQSGRVKVKIGALTHYDLLARQGGVYSVSQLGRRVLQPADALDYRAALVEAAKAPTLYAELVRDLAGQALPQLLPKILESKYGVLANTANDVAAVFRETMDFAGLIRHGVLYELPPVGDLLPSDNSSAAVTDSRPFATEVEAPTPAGRAEAILSEVSDYRIPLTRRRSAVLRLPLPLDATDVERIKKWLDLMGDVLTEMATATEEVEKPS